MAARAVKTSPLTDDAEQMRVAMDAARRETLALIAHLDEGQLEAVHSPIMSPLVWDLGHIAAYEDLWLAHRLAGLELLRGDLAALYDAFETPRAIRGEIEALRAPAALDYLAEVRSRAEGVLGAGIGEQDVWEMVLRHELQHCETMRQTMAIAGLLPPGETALQPMCSEEYAWLAVPPGSFAMGAREGRFAFDNERPRHTIELDGFAIARRPVSNASWMRFSEGGGYERREWWSDEGWAWKEEYDITHHASIADRHPEAPACHVSWFEADAFARSLGERLPTEAEWERAATWSQATAAGLADVGAVWEWTSSCFSPYPGFRPYPYREYSEVFFGDSYRVLRGGSWATHPRVASVTFRNWDLPERRQIFAGVRLVRAR